MNPTRPTETVQELIDQSARMLLEAAPPGSEVILFGSHATGRASQ